LGRATHFGNATVVVHRDNAKVVVLRHKLHQNHGTTLEVHGHRSIMMRDSPLEQPCLGVYLTTRRRPVSMKLAVVEAIEMEASMDLAVELQVQVVKVATKIRAMANTGLLPNRNTLPSRWIDQVTTSHRSKSQPSKRKFNRMDSTAPVLIMDHPNLTICNLMETKSLFPSLRTTNRL
jgi:hypothetical protein